MHRLQHLRPEAVATAVAGKVARYSLRAAVDGVTQALDTMRRSNVAMSN